MNDDASIVESKPLAFVLKQATESSHQTVEKYLSNILFSTQLTPSQYYQVLLAMKSAYVSMEAAMLKYSLTRNLMLARSKLAWLQADILYLNLDSSCTEDSVDPHFAQTEAEAIGAMYVMEGATLGGSFIYNKLRRLKWLSDSQGIEFFYNYGSERQEKWRGLQLALSQYDHVNPDARPLIINGANAAFNLINSSIRDKTIL